MHPEEQLKLRVARLTERSLEEAPEWDAPPRSCRYCLYWEHPDLVGLENRGEALALKRAWVRRTEEACGDCGRVICAGGLAVDYAQYAPPAFLPNAQTYPAGPASDDAVLLACLFLPSPADRGRGWRGPLRLDLSAGVSR